MTDAVAYYRVSTDRQGESGLGLEAQVEAVKDYSKLRGINIVSEFTEIESGKKSKRPILAKALKYCSANKALLIIAKLDRLGRNVAFISALMEKHVRFVAVDYPEANDLILHIVAAFAQWERQQISARTRDALRIAKSRGVVLGRNGLILAVKNKRDSFEFAKRLKPIIDKLNREGFRTVKALTDEMNRRGTPTFRPGSIWHISTVHAVLKKIAELKNTF